MLRFRPWHDHDRKRTPRARIRRGPLPHRRQPGGWQIEGLPATIRRAGPQAAERTVEFFTAQIRNPHTTRGVRRGRG